MLHFVLELNDGRFFFDTLPDLVASLRVVNEFAPFTEDCRFKVRASNDVKTIGLVVVGTKFEDHIIFGLSDESREVFLQNYFDLAELL